MMVGSLIVSQRTKTDKAEVKNFDGKRRLCWRVKVSLMSFEMAFVVVSNLSF